MTDGAARFNANELAVLKRFARGLDPSGDAELGEIARRVVEHVRERNGSATVETLEEALRLEGPAIDYDWTIRSLLAADDTESVSEIELDETPTSSFPEPPADARVDPELAAGAGKWIDQYVAFGLAVSPMTPEFFHEGAALWLGATSIARRLVLPMAFADVYPNLFVAWVAPSTLYRKTTALDLARRAARTAIPHLLTAQDSTPEAFVADLAGREPAHFEDLPAVNQEMWRKRRDFSAQRGLLLDEMSGLLASAGRDYNAGLLELYMRAFDCADQYERITRGQGLVVVRDAYLSLLGASTPSALGPHLSAAQLWTNGWWPRYALLCPPLEKPEWRTPTADPDTGLPAVMANVLRSLDGRLPKPTWPEPPHALKVRLDQAAYDLWAPYSKALTYDLLGGGLDERLYAAYGRLPTQALKVAIILAALDWGDREATPHIKPAHMARAVMITESWRASFHRLLEVTVETIASTRRGRLIRQIAKAQRPMSLRDIWRNMRDVDVKDLEDLVEEALKLGELEECASTAGPKGGRPSR
ncbi:MAG: DUF3987 domain-containing protein, partial [Chloroflexi bacterium]|nr:DUF3987 domain-containing protein [Chloroflexota bacterium]